MISLNALLSVDINPILLAVMFSNISGANGNDRGSENREKISAEMTPQQIEAQQMAREWMTKH